MANTQNTYIKENIINQIDKFPYNLQLRVLDFVKSLSPKGVKGEALLRFKGIISANDLREISKAIDEGLQEVRY
jgi:arginine decarboxylase-like protein